MSTAPSGIGAGGGKHAAFGPPAEGGATHQSAELSKSTATVRESDSLSSSGVGSGMVSSHAPGAVGGSVLPPQRTKSRPAPLGSRRSAEPERPAPHSMLSTR